MKKTRTATEAAEASDDDEDGGEDAVPPPPPPPDDTAAAIRSRSTMDFACSINIPQSFLIRPCTIDTLANADVVEGARV